jgi:hypothetical protein
MIKLIKRKNENVRILDEFIESRRGSIQAQVVRGERGRERD